MYRSGATIFIVGIVGRHMIRTLGHVVMNGPDSEPASRPFGGDMERR